MRRYLLACVTGMLLWGCGAHYGMRVPKDMLGSLTYENRVELLEPENEVAVAVDRLDEAENDVERTRQALRRAKSRAHAAEDEEGQAKDKASREVAQLAIAEAESRIDYLRAFQQVKLAEQDVQQLGVQCAVAHFEEARLQVLRKYKVKGSEGLKPDEFARQSKACERDLTGLREEVARREKEADRVEQVWNTHRAALAKRTFDARASPYVE
jgi:hypothetical protein